MDDLNGRVFELSLNNVTYNDNASFQIPVEVDASLFMDPVTIDLDVVRNSSTEFRGMLAFNDGSACNMSIEADVELADDDLENLTEESVEKVHAKVRFGDMTIESLAGLADLLSMDDPTQAEINSLLDLNVLFQDMKIADLEYDEAEDNFVIHYKDESIESAASYMDEEIITTLALILCMSAFLFSQESQTSESFTKHQIGINASKFVVLFNEQVNNLDVTYRYSLNNKQRLRLATSIDVSTEEGDMTNYEVRLGYDFNIKQTARWDFYTGFDVTYGQSIVTSTERTTTTAGPYLFFGALFKMGDHFSLSTEPSIAVFRKSRQDPSSFTPDEIERWTEFKLLNIGQIKVSFHF